jgi:hypothetical protein
MACHTLLFLIATQLSQAIFGKKCSRYKAPKCISAQLHPKTDGQTEVVNKCLETYLRCFSSKKQNQWAQWLPLAEWWYNTSYHTATRMTPFEDLYGKKPPSVLSYLPGASKVQAVDLTLTAREAILRTLKENFVMAHNRMKQQVDQGCSER